MKHFRKNFNHATAESDDKKLISKGKIEVEILDQDDMAPRPNSSVIFFCKKVPNNFDIFIP